MRHPADEPRWRRYLRFFRRSVSADIDDELRFHFDERIAELIAQGATPEAARSRAVEEFGDVTEVRRDLRSIDERLGRRHDRAAWLTGLVEDFVYSARSLRRTPIVAGTIVVTLALGLGLNVAMFSLLDVLYLRYPPGVSDARGVFRVWQPIEFSNTGLQYTEAFGYPQYRALVDALGNDADVALTRVAQRRALRGDHDGAFAQVTFTSASYFPVLGVRAARGRMYTSDEDRMGSPVQVAVISDAFWRSRLGAADNVVGSKLLIGNDEVEVIGIAPPGFTGIDISAIDVWLPAPMFLRTRAGWWTTSQINGFSVLVRPRTGVRADQLSGRIAAALRDPVAMGPQVSHLLDPSLASVIRARGPGRSSQEIVLATRLAGVAVLVLLIAIANVVNLLMARAIQRRREIAVRLALGISRVRLLRLLVSESVLLAGVAGVAAVLAASWGGALLRTTLLPTVQWGATPMHWRVLAFAIVAALVAGIVAGIDPALQSLAPDLTNSLKAGARTNDSGRRSRRRAGLLVVQAALSMILLVGATLFVKSLQNVRGLDIGFDQDRLSFADVTFTVTDTARDTRVANELYSLVERLRGRPGVERVALTNMQPMLGMSFETYFPDADTVLHRKPMTTFVAVTAEYFETIGIRFLRGNGFPMDGSRSQEVVINLELAESLWPGENPIGRCMRFTKPNSPCYRIAGVVENANRDRVIERRPNAQYYLPLNNMPFPGWVPGIVIVRSKPEARAAVGAEIQNVMRAAFPSGKVFVRSMNDALEGQYRPWQLGATLFTLFGALALLVAVIGIYGTIAYSVGQRVREFGVRIAVGARMRDVMELVVVDALTIVGLGVLLGIVGSIVGGQFVSALLFDVEPADTKLLGGTAVVFLLIAVAAALAPAWRAARVNPVTALRAD